MLAYLILKKNFVRSWLEKCYYKYGLFCSLHPILMILFSCTIIIACSLPLTSFPIFEKTITFLFQRIKVNYDTSVSLVSDKSSNGEVLAYVQQVYFNTSLTSPSELSTDNLLQKIMQLDYFKEMGKKLRYPSDIWNSTCLQLHRDPPSMKALKKRIKFPRGSIHEDLKMRTFYNLQCLFLGPIFLLDDGSDVVASDLSNQFKELVIGYPLHSHVFGGPHSEKKHISFVFTFFLRKTDKRFLTSLIKDLQSVEGFSDMVVRKGNSSKINFKFSEESGPAELIPLTIAYVVAFLYLWFSVAKLDLIRTRWGLAFSAVMNCCFSFIMAMGICAIFDVLPSTVNVGEIFPYVVLAIGIENFWIITKSVMMTKKDLEAKDRVAIGLGKEGWFITKNLVMEFFVLFVAFCFGFQEYSIFALACYLSDFFLQMTFFTPILAVDIRRAEVGLPFTDRSAWKYALCIEIERPETSIRSVMCKPNAGFSAAVKVAFHIARYRIIQRSVMVFMVIYFSFVFVTLPIHEIVNPVQSREIPSEAPNTTPDHLSCLNAYESHRINDVLSWQTLCGKHWPELFNYYFIHLDKKALLVLPQIDVQMIVDPSTLDEKVHVLPQQHHFLVDQVLRCIRESPKTMGTLGCILILTLLYKCVTLMQTYIQKLRTNADFYTCEQSNLIVPSKNFIYKVTKMAVDETDVLVSAFNNGSLYVWDLYNSRCSYYINRGTRDVHVFGIPRCLSAISLPSQEVVDSQNCNSTKEIPLAVWCLSYKFEVLVVGCDLGSLEVYSLEKGQESLKCLYDSENKSGIVSVKMISCLRFVAGHKNGVIDFFHLKAKQNERARSNSLPELFEAKCEIIISRSVTVFHQELVFMEIAVDKLYVSSMFGQVKILRTGDDGGIPLQTNLSREIDITVLKTELSPEMALLGTNTGQVYVLDSFGQIVKSLLCGEEEVMSIASDDDYIAALAFDGVLTVWLKEGYIKWWQVNLITYGGAYEILPLARYSLAAVSKDFVILLNIVTRNIIDILPYEQSPLAGLIMALPLVCQNKSSLVVSCGSAIAHLKFPKLIDHKR